MSALTEKVSDLTRWPLNKSEKMIRHDIEMGNKGPAWTFKKIPRFLVDVTTRISLCDLHVANFKDIETYRAVWTVQIRSQICLFKFRRMGRKA